MNTSTKSLQLLSLLIADFCNKICHNRTLFKRTLDETAPRH